MFAKDLESDRKAALRQSALDHLWMHNRDWVTMAEEGGPDVICQGEGARVVDIDGKEWIDVNGGYSSVNVGYGRKDIAESALEQMRRLSYFPQGAVTEPLVRLAEKLAQITPGTLERSWPVTGGSEANETAIKISRAYHNRRGAPGRYKIISRRGSYHGALGTVMWLGGGTVDRADYEPAYPGMLYAPQPSVYRCEQGGQSASECAVRCAEALEKLILFHGPDTIAAFIGEPMASGASPPGEEYWPMVRQICDRYGVLLISDEVITGFGRTGRMFAMEHWGVVPDILTMAKGLTSSYLPMAASIATRDVADAFAGSDNIFRQSLTFGGHPVTAQVALKNIDIIQTEGLVQNAAEVGVYFLEKLQNLKEKHEIIGDVRGLGLLLGMEFVKDRDSKQPFSSDVGLGQCLNRKLKENGLILSCRDSSISFGPPLCIDTGIVDEIVSGLDKSLYSVERDLDLS